MKIGVLSDTHNSLSNVIYAVETLRDRGIETLIHCGDLTDFDLISQFEGFRLIYLLGNMDQASGTIVKRVQKMNPENFAGTVFTGNLDGVSIAATHSHIEGEVMELVRSRKYQWIFHGHTHRRRDEIVGGVRIVNPGALGGMNWGLRTFCVVDLTEGNVEFVPIPLD